MNLEVHNPELVQRVNAHIEAGHFHDRDEFIEKALAIIDERMPAVANGTKAATEPFWQSFTSDLHALPDAVFEGLPTDSASEHDHYLYGAPKRSA